MLSDPAERPRLDDDRWRRGIYRPLDTTKRQIRLLNLERSSNVEDNPICTISVVSLDDDDYDFFALPYVWVDQSNPRCVWLIGHQVPVGRSAHAPLRYLRLGNEVLHIWIDAICIKQKDIPERNHQVALMKDVYSLATGVWMWLGEADDHHTEAANAFDQFWKIVRA